VTDKNERIDYDFPWWMKTLAGIGGVTVAGIILTLFFSLGRRPSDILIPYNPPVTSPDFITGLAGVAGAPVRTGGTAKLLNNGDAFYPALHDAVRNAKQSVNFAVYIWEDSQPSRELVPLLVERARAGVQVRVLLDGLGGLHAPEEQIRQLQDAGAKVKIFRSARFGRLSRFHKRNHRRTIVIDGSTAFTGGMAIADQWLGHGQDPEHWRDSMTMVTGPLAATIQSGFVNTWAHVPDDDGDKSGEILVGPAFFPVFPEPVAAPGESIAVHTGLASAPSSEDHPIRLVFLQTFAAARQKLYIANSYFVPDETIRKTVIARAKAGVDVRILLPGENTDAKPIRQTSHSYYQELMDAGVKIYEYQPTMMHAKTVVVDGMLSIVGSSNMDVRSKELNQENVLAILDQGFAAELEASYLDDLTRAQQIDPEEWKKRGPLKRFTERLSSLLAEQY
jgi:cardiolipin synthase A/B